MQTTNWETSIPKTPKKLSVRKVRVYVIWIKTTLPTPHPAQWSRHSTQGLLQPGIRGSLLRTSSWDLARLQCLPSCTSCLRQVQAGVGAPYFRPNPTCGTEASIMGVSHREKLAIVPTPNARVQGQRFYLREEAVIKQVVPDLFPQKLTSFATQLGEI